MNETRYAIVEYRIVKKAITHLTFDFFGTLVDYTPGHFSGKEYAQTYKLLLKNGHTIKYEDFVSAFSATFDDLERKAKISSKEFHMDEVSDAFFKKYLGTKVDKEERDEFVETYISEWNKGITYIPKLDQLLKVLAKKYTLSIISNTHYPSLVSGNLDAIGVSDYFSIIVTSVEYGIRKPNKKIFDETLKRLSVSPNEVMHIGDSMRDDFEGATNAGIRAILIDGKKKWGSVSGNKIESIFELEGLLL